MRWFLAIALAVALVAAACASQPSTAQPAAPPVHAAGQVYVGAGEGQPIWVVDVASGSVARTLPDATPAPGWRSFYRLSAGTLESLDPLTGGRVATHPAPAWASAVRTSADGRWLVFGAPGPGDRFLVQDAAWRSAPVSVRLHGSFAFDGLSPDGQRLYLLERLDAGHYQVRMYDLRQGTLAPYVIADKSEIGQPMSGTALASFINGPATLQLTLYQGGAKGQAFVHVLPVAQALPFAYCVDLPGPADGWGFAAAPDGRHMYAVNPTDQRVVELDASSDAAPSVRQRRSDVAMGRSARPALAVAPDGATLYLGTDSGVAAIDAGTLKVGGRGLSGRTVTALSVAPDGRTLYATSGASLLRLDPRTLAVAGEVTLPAPAGGVLHAA
jgi:DNA-binding beta-propeller fold protein YncE